MASKIRVLDEQTINQIAAGEVIENPSSVVKELVENSIDAGATEICVEIKGGGRQLIRITDNGCGMNRDDALLCLERHATSKIRELEDIHSIYTMGFRGEAVPSIASISKFTLMTCPTSENQEGTMVIVDGGKIIQCCPIARSQGTTIEVKSLFFNVPVRKKFQKSPAYDANEILKVISNMALGHPGIKFELISDQKSMILTHPDGTCSFLDSLKLRIEEILGSEFSSAIYPIEIMEGDFHLQGFIGTPGYTRHNRTGQHLFINKRAVVSPLISFAVRDGYGTALLTNRHPVYVLHLTIPGKLVDVNVHPQKHEVRLRQEQVLKELIMKAVRNGLQQSGPTSLETIEFPQIDFIEKEEKIFNLKPDFFYRPFSEPERKPPQEQPLFSASVTSSPKVVMNMKHYIFVEATSLPNYPQILGEGFCVIDHRLAHARVIFEKLSKDNTKLSLQTLLIPYTFEATPVETDLLQTHLESLNSLGISIRQSGPHAFLVDAIPQVFGNSDIRALITEVVNAINENNGTQVLQQEHQKRIALAASKAAISHQKRLTLEEAQSIVNQLMQCSTPYQCPLGKPTVVYIGYDELAKRFK